VTRFRLDGKVALVTGGASGIGEATARAAAEQGARVCVADLNEARGTDVAASLGEAGFFQALDVTDANSCDAAVAACRDRLGRLDVLVNCAGIGFVGNVEETPLADWHTLFAVNVTGVFLCSKAGVQAMLAQDPPGGVIVNLASVVALVGLERRYAYSATKGAVLAMSRQMAIDYVQRGIRVVAVCPGTIYTPFVDGYLDRFHRENKAEVVQQLHARQPLGRMGRPEEVADYIVYLASDEAAFLTGAAPVIDGGLTAR
jgi:2-keto-3-deoxy-L-fuconate dehydrogenase